MPQMRASHDVVVAVAVRRVLGIFDRTSLLVVQHGAHFPTSSFCQPTTPLCQFRLVIQSRQKRTTLALPRDRASAWQHLSAHAGNLLDQSLERPDCGIGGQVLPAEVLRRCAIDTGLLGIARDLKSGSE